MVNVKQAAQSLARLCLLRFFPSDANAQAALVQIVCQMAANNEQVDWLVNRMLSIYNEWPGPHEMRACFVNRFRPKDGINAVSTVHLDGSWPKDPTAPPRVGIESPTMKMLSGGKVASEDAECEKMVCDLSKAKAMPKARVLESQFTRRLREIDTAPQDRKPLPAPEPISDARRAEIQAMIDAEVAKRRHA